MNKIWPVKKLGEVAEIYQPKTITSKEILEEGPYKVFGANGVIGYYDQYNHEDPEVIVTCRGATCGTINFSEPQSWITGNAMVVHPKDETLLKDFLYYSLKSQGLTTTISGTAQPQITRSSLAPFQIAIPAADIQKKIVERLDAIRKAQELCNSQISKTEELFRSLLTTEINIENTKTINSLIAEGYIEKMQDGNHGEVHPKATEFRDQGTPFIFANHLKDLEMTYLQAPKLSKEVIARLRVGFARKGDVLLTTKGTVGLVGKVPEELEECVLSPQVTFFRIGHDLMPKFLMYSLLTKYFQDQLNRVKSQATRDYVSQSRLKKLYLPFVSVSKQQKIVEKLSAVREHKKLLLKQKTLLRELFDSVLDKCMKGELHG